MVSVVIIGYMQSHNTFNLNSFCKITVPTIYNFIGWNILNVNIYDIRIMKYKPEY